MSVDIGPILKYWEYLNESMMVELDDKGPKGKHIHIRLGTGCISMSPSGRPDGTQPSGFRSYWEFFEQKYAESENDCIQDSDALNLLQEIILFNARSLAYLHLKEYIKSSMDALRNLHVVNFLINNKSNYTEQFELIRPHVQMVYHRTLAEMSCCQQHYEQAIKYLVQGIEKIGGFVKESLVLSESVTAREIKVLSQFQSDLELQFPYLSRVSLEKELKKAVKEEDYELAVSLRNRIQGLVSSTSS